MLLNFTGKKNELTSSLAEATTSVESLKKIDKTSFKTRNDSYEPLKSQMVKFEKYMPEVDKLFKDIEILTANAGKDLAELKAAQTKGMTAFKEYDDKLKPPASDAAAGDAAAPVVADAAATIAAPNSTEIDAAKKAADAFVKTVDGLNTSIIEKYSEAKGLAEGVMKDAKFSFIKEDAEAKVNELGNDNTSAEVAAKKLVDELEEKRKISYKISNIEQLKVESGKLDKLLKDMKKYEETDIGPIKSEVEAKNKEVASKIEEQAQAKETNITDITNEITGLVKAGAAVVSEATQLKNKADAKLQEIKNLNDGIQQLYTEMKLRKSDEFDTTATTLVSISTNSAQSLKDATEIQKKIDAAVTAAGETQKRTEEMADLYAQIYTAYKEASGSVASFGLDTKLGEQTWSKPETKSTVDRLVEGAKAANQVIMGFASHTVLNASQMTTIQQKYDKIVKSKNELDALSGTISTQNGEFEQSVKIGLLDKLQDAVKKVTGPTKNLFVDDYANKVLKELNALLERNSRKVEDNKTNRAAFSKDIIDKSIADVSNLAESAINRIDLLKILHKTDTCLYIGNRLKFDTSTLSGVKTADITFNSDNRIATQKQTKFKCLWLRTVDGIPTNCPSPVEWKIKISRTTTNPGDNLPEITMGIGLDSFNPVTTAESNRDCDPIPGFWGANGTTAFTNGNIKTEIPLSNITSIFKSDNVVTFTLSPATLVGGDKNNFDLKIESDGNRSVTLQVEVAIDVGFLYPIVRFNTVGDTYEIVHDTATEANSPAGKAAAAKAAAEAKAAAAAAATAAAADATAAAAADTQVRLASDAQTTLSRYESSITSTTTVRTERVSPSIIDLTNTYTKFSDIDTKFKTYLKKQAKSIANSIIAGADTTFKILRKVFPFAVDDLDKAIIATSPPSALPPLPPQETTDDDLSILTQKLKFMSTISNNYITKVSSYVNGITSTNARKGMFGIADKFDLAEIKRRLKADTDNFTNGNAIQGYAIEQIARVNQKIDAIGALDPTGKDFKYNDLGQNMVLAYLTSELSALNVSANQYMSSSLTSIKGTVDSAFSVLEKDILATFVFLIASAQSTTSQKSDMLIYANSIKLAYGKFTPEVKKIYENVQLLQPLAAASLLAAGQAKLVADAAAKAAAAAAALVSASTASTAAQQLLSKETSNLAFANEAKESIDSFSNYLKFISGVTAQVNPLVDVIFIMCSDDSVDTFFAGGGGGGKGNGGKSLMTRRNRLRFKKSRVITRRSSSSRLSHLSRTSRARLGIHSKGDKGGKGGKGGKGVKASTTRKLNGGVVVGRL